MPEDEYGNYYDDGSDYPTYGGYDAPPTSNFGADSPVGGYNAAATDSYLKGLQQAYNASVKARADAPGGATNPASSMSTARSAVSSNPSISSGGGGDGGMTAYQQAQLGLSQQQLNQSANQFQQTLANQANIAAGNLGFNYAQLGQQGSQFQQNYGIDYQQLLNATQGTPFQWAGLGLNANQMDIQQGLDQQRIDLSRQLGQGDDARGWAQLALAEEDHDLRMYLGQGQLAQSQAEIAATMTRLGIDVYQTNVNAQIAQARLALDQQVESARAGALSQQAAADAARAQAALRAVEVELQLGEGNLEQGYAKLAQAERFGLEDISLRREELGLKDKVATQDLALNTLLGVEGINVSREKLANDKMLGISDQQTRRDIAQLNAQVERERMGQQGGQFQQQFGLDLAKAQSAENIAKWNVQAGLRGPRDWAKSVEMRRLMGEGGANPFAALAPGAGQLAGDVGGPSEPISWETFLQDNGLPAGTQFPAGGQTNQPWQGQVQGGGFDMNSSPWQQMVAGGSSLGGSFQAPTANPWGGQNLPTQGGTMDWNTIYQQITGQSGGTTAAGQQGPLRVDTNGWTPPGQVNAGSLWDPNFTEGQPYTGQVAGSQIDPGFADAAARATGTGGGNFADTPGSRRTVDANGNESWSAVQGPSANDLTSFGGLPVQETYVNAQGYQYVVPAGYGPQSPGDKRIGGPAPKPQTEPLINANGTVTMPNGTTQDARGNPLPAGAQTNQPATFGPGQPQVGGYNGQFQAPTAGGFQPYDPGNLTGSFNGIPIPAIPQIAQPAPPSFGGNSIVAQLMQQYMSQYSTPAAQQSPQGQSALQFVTAMMNQARSQQAAPVAATPPGQAPPAGTATPPTMNTGQPPAGPPSFQNPTTQNFMPVWEPNSPYYPQSSYYGTPAAVGPPDSPGVYATGGNAGTASFPAGEAPPGAGGFTKTNSISTYDQYRAANPPPSAYAAPARADAPRVNNTGSAAAYNQAITGGAVPQPAPAYPQYTVPSPGPTTYSHATWANSPANPGQSTGEGAAGNPSYADASYDMPEPSGQSSLWGSYAAYGVPQYATGTPRVPVTGPAIVHEGEAIVPASQNPNNQWDEMARLQAQWNGTPSTFQAPVANQQPQVQQAAPPAAPADLNDLTSPQAPAQPNQQQLAANQQPMVPQQPQPVANAPQHAQPTSPPDATVETAGLTPPAPTPQVLAQQQWNAVPVTTSPAQYRGMGAPQAALPVQAPVQPVQDTAYWQQRLAFLEQSTAGDWDPAAQAMYRQQADAIRARLAQQPAAPPAAALPVGTPTPATPGFVAPVATPPANPLATSAALYNNLTPTPVPAAGENPFAVTPGQPQFNQPVTGQASVQNPMGRLFSSLPAPQQVSYRVWSQDLSPSERDMALSAWEAQGYWIPDVQQLIENNRLTRQQGAFGSGYAGIGR